MLPHFLVTGPACLFGSSCPLSRYPPPTFPPQPPLPPPLLSSSLSLLARLAIVAGPAFSSIFPLTLALTTTHSHYLGPACHCGRSRLVSPPSYLSTPHIRTILISITPLTFIPLPPHHIWPGLSLWQVPPTPPHFQHITTLPPSSSSSYHPPLSTSPWGLHCGPACHCGRSHHIILSRFISDTSFLALPPTNPNLQAYSTSPPSSRPGLPLWLVSPFPLPNPSLSSIHTPHLFL